MTLQPQFVSSNSKGAQASSLNPSYCLSEEVLIKGINFGASPSCYSAPRGEKCT
jgi:hypothetical protein